MTSISIRPVVTGAIPDLRTVMAATELFPADMLQDMLAPYLSGTEDQIWLAAHLRTGMRGFCFAETEPMTERTWNMRALAVHPQPQRTGAGRRLVASLEDWLRERGQRLLIVDTASGPDLAPARAFRCGIGYEAEACIRDF